MIKTIDNTYIKTIRLLTVLYPINMLVRMHTKRINNVIDDFYGLSKFALN